jgi:imidazolonepropionase-like amidohydrolase
VHINFEQAQRALRFGVTTARAMGGRFIDIELRDAHRRGRLDIPEVLAAGYQIRPAVISHPWFVKDFPELADMKPPLSGTANLRRIVRAFAAKGVDHIKVLATERADIADADPRKRNFTDEELIAIVDEARKAGLKVVAHAYGDEGAYAAVKAGVHSIEHGSWLTDETLKLMKSRGTWFVTNIFDASATAFWSSSISSQDPILVERRRTMRPSAKEVTRRAYKLGVPLVGATDFSYDSNLDSGRLTIANNAAGLVEAGIPRMDAIKAITSGPAKLLGIDNRTGAIRKGFEADIVVLGSDPMLSMEALKDIRMVLNNGKVTGKEVTGSPSAMYVARVLSANESSREAFLECMQRDDLKIRQELKRKGLLSVQSVFETSSTNINTPDAPFWSFLILTRLGTTARSEDLFRAEEQLSKKGKRANCFDGAGVETRRIEVLRTTPNSFYPHGVGGDLRSDEFSVRYIVEYIAVQNTPAALDEYRETMRTMLGPVQGHMIKEGSLLNFIALETVSVKYSQSGMPEWNQIHVRGGNFPEGKMPSPSPGMDRALKFLFPSSGGASVVFGRLRTIRTKRREDVARQLGDLAIR